jgi:UDP-glucuronate decarboxylase
MRALVTGGGGFLGSHLCDRLLAAGHEVVALDNFFTGSKRNIAHLLGRSDFELIRHDVVNPILVEVDWVFNFACPASPIHYQNNPVKTVKTSVMGTLHMLGLAKRVHARILQASTSEVYGDPAVHPQPESYWGNVNPIGRRSCYDEGKRVAETLLTDYHRQNNVDIRIVRIFNTYGPRMAVGDGRVISNFIVQALRGEPLTIYGDGSQTRSFLYVDDLLDGVLALMSYEGPDAHEPVNIGSPREQSMLELVDCLGKVTGKKLEIVFRPLPEDDPVRRCALTTRAQERLNWSAEVTLEEGLARTVDYFKGILPECAR